MAVQALGGIGSGATFAMGALLAAQLGGVSAGGMAATGVMAGAAIFAVPLARLVPRLGRGLAMSLGLLIATGGAGLAVTAAALASFPLLLVAFLCLGAATTANLQARFAAADVASARSRGRDLSLVMWSTTIGAVLGPNLLEPGNHLGGLLGLPEFTGSYLFAMAAQFLGIVVLIVFVGPLGRHSGAVVRQEKTSFAEIIRRTPVAPWIMAALAVAHFTMVAIMAMTPVHMTGHGHSLTIVGITISLHVFGMYGLSPVFGVLADRWGRVRTAVAGGVVLILSGLLLILFGQDHVMVMIALAGVGFGWSMVLIATSALINDYVAQADRPTVQGTNDLMMNLAGALGGASSGVVLAVVGMPGLAWLTIALIVLTAAATWLRWRGQVPVKAGVPASRSVSQP